MAALTNRQLMLASGEPLPVVGMKGLLLDSDERREEITVVEVVDIDGLKRMAVSLAADHESKLWFAKDEEGFWVHIEEDVDGDWVCASGYSIRLGATLSGE